MFDWNEKKSLIDEVKDLIARVENSKTVETEPIVEPKVEEPEEELKEEEIEKEKEEETVENSTETPFEAHRLSLLGQDILFGYILYLLGVALRIHIGDDAIHILLSHLIVEQQRQRKVLTHMVREALRREHHQYHCAQQQ